MIDLGNFLKNYEVWRGEKAGVHLSFPRFRHRVQQFTVILSWGGGTIINLFCL